MTKESKICFSMAGILFGGMVGSFISFPVFADGPVNISIVEMAEDGSGGYKEWEDITGAMPGMTYSAIPRVRNDGEVEVDVRLCLSESATNSDGVAIVLPANTFGIEISENWVLDDENSVDVSDPAAGNCYKYNSRLGVNMVTEPLFYEVSLSPELGNEYQDSTFSLHLLADAAGDLPANPDTGVSTNSEPLTVVGYVSLSVGLVILVGMIIYLLSKKAQKR